MKTQLAQSDIPSGNIHQQERRDDIRLHKIKIKKLSREIRRRSDKWFRKNTKRESGE